MTSIETTPQVEFPYRISWTRNYKDLFRGEHTETTGIDDTLRRAAETGRVMLCGKGGSGKTTIVSRVSRLSQSSGIYTVFVDMRRWSPKLQVMLEGLDDDPLARADLLLAVLGDPPFPLSAIDEKDPQQPKLVIIDGLNEVRSDVAQQLIVAADRLAASFLNLAVIATDRLVRRDLNEERWNLGMVLPLDEGTVQQMVSDTLGEDAWRDTSLRQREILEIPFFLDKVLGDRQMTLDFDDYLQQHTGLTEDGMDAAAQGAYATYRSGFGGRSFPKDTFIAEAGPATESLEEAGIIVSNEDISYFQHHLFHDYLAARYLAAHSDEWGGPAFDALSFNASSFDAVSKVLDQLEPDRTDDFIRKVYDWNPYAAAYAISETASSERRVSKEMGHVIAAMLGERQWDIVRPTVVRAEDALAILGSEQARRYLEAASINEVIALVADVKGEGIWFDEWQRLFTRQPATEPEDRKLELLEAEDSILGWTATNVFRRLATTDRQLEYIRSLAEKAQSGTVRWRGVHVLGAFPRADNAEVLLNRLMHDDYEWVKYGALRSLMEMAARSTPLRSEIMEGLTQQADLLANNKLLKREFASAADMNIETSEAESWISNVGRVVRALADRAEDERELERWARLSSKLVERYAA